MRSAERDMLGLFQRRLFLLVPRQKWLIPSSPLPDGVKHLKIVPRGFRGDARTFQIEYLLMIPTLLLLKHAPRV
jgi:hypothetical protein